MKRTVPAILFVAAIILSTRVPFVHSQATDSQIALLDRAGKAVTSIVDGNQVQLQVKISLAVDRDTKILFLSPDIPKPIAECLIPSGKDSCETPRFASLGWYWDPDGNATPQRPISASLDGSQPLGSLSVSVRPRPVIMVHGFNADYKTWTAYLGPEGFLASLGLKGFAVGDGQVPGDMQTGSLSEPFKRTNTIAQNAAILGEYIDHVQQATGAEKVDLLVH